MSKMAFVFSQESGGHENGGGGGKKPPDRTQFDRPAPISFKDKLVGPKMVDVVDKDVDLLQQGIFEIKLVNGDRLLPKCYVQEEFLKSVCDPWKDTLVVRLLGKNLGFMIMKEKLQNLWKPKGGMDILDLGHGYFSVSLDLAEDRDRILVGGPWVIFDHYLCIRPWSPKFMALEAKEISACVWIRFPSLNAAFYDKRILMALAAAVGSPKMVDMNTLNITRGRFARVCVEIDLTLPVVGRVWFCNN